MCARGVAGGSGQPPLLAFAVPRFVYAPLFPSKPRPANSTGVSRRRQCFGWAYAGIVDGKVRSLCCRFKDTLVAASVSADDIQAADTDRPLSADSRV